MMMITISPPITGSTPLSPARIRLSHACMYSPKVAATFASISATS